MSSHAQRRDFFLLVSASIFWGTVGVANQAIYAQSATNGLSLAFWRLAIAAALFLLAAWVLLRRRLFQIKPRDAGLMTFMGGLQALYQLSYSSAIPLAGVTVSTLIALCGAPIIVALVSTFLLRERLTPRTLTALVSAISGTLLLVAARTQPGEGHASLFGAVLALFSACGYAGYLLCGRRLTSRYHFIHINCVAFGTGALLLLCFVPLIKLVSVYPLGSWLLLLYLGGVPTALAYGLFQIGIRSHAATVVSIITLCEALTAAVLAWIFFHEQLGLLSLVGAGLLLAAMALILLTPLKPA